jgi:hypothetical protein
LIILGGKKVELDIIAVETLYTSKAKQMLSVAYLYQGKRFCFSEFVHSPEASVQEYSFGEFV